MFNKKSKLKFIIILLFVILVILLINLFNVSDNKNDILDRLISGLDNLNYTYIIDNGKTNIQVFGKYEKRASEDKIKYLNYDDSSVNEVYVGTGYMEIYKNNGIDDISYYNNYIKYYFDSDLFSYKYVGKKEIDGKKYTVVKFIDDIAGKAETYIWINDETNVIYKVEYYYFDNNKKEKISEEILNFDTGSNKLEDVKVPASVFKEYSTRTD